MKKEVIVRGWQHAGCGPWKMILAVPDGYEQVVDGISLAGDLCAVATDKGVKMAKNRSRHKGDKEIPGIWELVSGENLGQPLSNFRAVIRRVA